MTCIAIPRIKQLALWLCSLLILSCSGNPAPKLEEFKDKKIVSKGANINFFPAADILFIVDDSGSMRPFQENLAQNTDTFIETFFKARFLDYHIGVTSSSSNPTENGSLASGGLLRDDAGVAFIDRSVEEGASILRDYVQLGASGSYIEEFFSILTLAFSRKNMAFNQGFFRDDAVLLIVIVTDTDDQSNTTRYEIPKLVEFLKRRKGNDISKISVLSAVLNVEAPDCLRTETLLPEKITAFTKAFNGSVFNLCAKDYGTPLGKAAREIVQRASTISLNQIPELKTLKLTYGSQVIPQGTKKGWSYLPDSNQIFISPDVELKEEPLGTPVTIDFEAVYK